MGKQQFMDFATTIQEQRAAAVGCADPMLLTVVEAARILGCGRTLIYQPLGSGTWRPSSSVDFAGFPRNRSVRMSLGCASSKRPDS